MEFIKRRFSMNSESEKDKGEKSSSGILGSLANRRATLWDDFTAKIKPDKGNLDASDNESDSKSVGSGKTFMDTVKEKLQKVKLYENGEASSETGSTKLRGSEPECAPLIDTTEHSTDGDSDAATCGESEVAQSPLAVNGAKGSASTPNSSRRRLSKRQDSFTAEEVYMDTVAAQVRDGLVQADSQTTLVSPSRAVQEFSFADTKTQKKLQTKKKSTNSLQASNGNSLQVSSGNLMNFDSIQNLSAAASSIAETVVHHEDDIVLDYESSGDESSEPVYTEFASRQSNSLYSINSIDSTFEDDESQESKEYAVKFVELIFSDITPTPEEKSKLAECIRDGNFRLNFARAISEKRGRNRAVGEHTFYQLVQYFALVLFECSEADDFSPAVILMNMCFTFYHEVSRGDKVEKSFLSTYLKSQPIWQSMRYWNAAFYESVQKERVKKPLTTNHIVTGSSSSSTLSNVSGGSSKVTSSLSPISEHSSPESGKDNAEDEGQDRQFQENIIFGQLGTFLYNMRAFGLNMEWCLEFLRKQSTIGNLSEEHIQMLRESVESMKSG